MSKKTYPRLTKEFNDISYNILENGFLTGDATWCYPQTTSPYHRMYFFMDGEAIVRNNVESVTLKPGFVYLIPANTSHDYICTSTLQKFYIHFEVQVLPGLDMFKELGQILCLSYDDLVLDLIRVHAIDPSMSGLLHLKAILFDYTAKFLTLATAVPDFAIDYNGYHRQREVLAYMEEHLSVQLKVEDVAAAMHVTPSALTRSFKQDIGVGIKRYIEMQILRKSKYMLLDSTKSIAEIADAFDFCDAYYFSRFFKRYEHIPPREYRKRIL